MKSSGSRIDQIAGGSGARSPGGSLPPWNEAERLEALARYDILDTPREPEFDDIARLAADIFEAPIAVVNLIAEGRQWFKAEVGIGADELPLDVSICAHAILQSGIFVVPDTIEDARFRCNPLVTGEPGLRFYAGALLETPEGLPLGTVCVLDTKPRLERITDRQRLTLEVLARQVMAQLELRRAVSQRDHRADRLEAEILRRRDAEAALEQTTHRLDAVLNNTRMAVFLMDEHQHCIYANTAAEILTGYAFADMQGRALHDVVHHKRPDGRHYPIEECPIDRAFPERAQMSGEELFVAPDGSFYPVAFTASPLIDEEGRPFGTVIEARNIADQREREARLRESGARLEFLDRLGAETAPLLDADDVLATTTRLLGEHLNLSVCAYADMDDDQDGFTIRGDWAAPGSTSIVGHYSLADFGQLAVANLGAGLPLIVNDNLRELAPEEAATFQNIGIASTICMPLVKEGRLTALMAIHDRMPRNWTEAELSLLGEVTARSWAHVERVAAVAELRASEAQLRVLNDTLEQQVVDRSHDLRLFKNIVQSDRSPVCAFDREYKLIAFNRAHNDEFRRVNGFDSKVGDVFPDLFVPEQRPVMRQLMARALAGERFTVVEEFGRPELGRPYWEISYTPLRDESGTIIGAFHHAKDVSSRMQAEAELAQAQEALRQSQKLESMGQLTGGVAHDFNNLLTPIIGSLDMLVRKRLGSERERRLIDGALQSAERAKTLVQRLLAFARRQPLQPSAVDLSRLVAEMAGLIGSTLGPNIDVQVKLEDDMPPAHADSNQLEMALLNLAVNARDAMPDGGVLTIEAKRAKVDAEHETKLQPGDYAFLCVTDTGAGMDQETASRAIEPFFSTKGIGKGTGLGLSMVHGLVAQLGGRLIIDSTLGQGTAVGLWLPVSADQRTSGEVTPLRPPPLHRRGRALLVDDEELVRMSTADMLIDLGFDVVEAVSAEDALRMVHGGAAPALLVTDHLMPGMNGADLARALRETTPDLPVLIVSGYADAEGLPPEFPRLTKPFRNAELAASLAALLPDEVG